MRALITGSAGFVGRHTMQHLDDLGWDTVGVDIAAHESVGLDALDYFRVSGGFAKFDLVVHAAASAPHRNAIDNEHGHFARNLQLDAAMFDWAVRTKQRRVLYLSSSAVYPLAYQRRGGYLEPLYESMVDLDDAEEPDAEYGWAKLTGERMARAARRAGLAVSVVRPFSGYGVDQSPDFPFRAILERVRRQDDPLVVWGDGSQVRDWIHIDDVVAGMLAVAESGTEDPVNLCTGIGTSIMELALMMSRRSHPTIKALDDKPAGVAYRVGDPARFFSIYRPKVSLEEAVARALRS